jgi:hypothetical protein
MSVTARITPIWRKQKLFVGIFLLGFGAYFFWDGAVGWPRSNERFLKHEEFQKAGDLEGWRVYAKERGWSAKPPEKLHTRGDIVGQFVCGGIASLAGLIAMAYWLQQIRRTISMDDEAVTSPAGTRVPFSAVTGLGLKKWESKGLAVVRYEIDGRKGEFVVDDYKFETESAKAIVEEIKRRLEARAGAAQ